MSKSVKRLEPKKAADFLINNSVYFAIAILVVVTAVQYPLFIKNAPLDLVYRTAAYVIIALGMGSVMLISGIDLSAGNMMGLASVIFGAILIKQDHRGITVPWLHELPIVLVLFCVLIIAASFGAFNGFFIDKFKIHPFLVTLCTQLILRGSILIVSEISPVRRSSISGLTDEYKRLITNTVDIGSWSIPNYVWFSIIIIGLMWIVWNYTSFGKKMRLYGKNHEAAKTLNINSLAITVAVFAMAGTLYCLNGFIEAARLGGPGVSTGSNTELGAIIACVLGGVSLRGGIGKIGGIIVGVVLLQLVSVCLQWLSVSANAVYIIKGALMLWAVAIDARKNYMGSGPAIWKW